MFIRIFVIFLLLFNGVGAFYGGINLISHPDGSSLGMTTEILRTSPFPDFLIPGIILIISIGIGSFVGLFLLILKVKHYQRSIIAEGVILLCWLIVQMLMIRMIVALHYILAVTGFGMIICGALLGKIERRRGMV